MNLSGPLEPVKSPRQVLIHINISYQSEQAQEVHENIRAWLKERLVSSNLNLFGLAYHFLVNRANKLPKPPGSSTAGV